MSDAEEQQLTEQVDSLSIDQPTSSGEEKQPDTQNLNSDQKEAYRNICEKLDQNGNSVIMINAPSETGKTFLLRTLAKNYQKSEFITFRKDQASNITLEGIQTNTFVSFCTRHFNLTYHQAIQMFHTSRKDMIEELYKVILYSKKFVAEDTSVLILDIYTIPSPAMLILLYILSLKHKLHLIFAGDGLQLNSISKSVFHKESNYYIIQILQNLTISNLNKSMRIHDPVLQEKVQNFYKLLQQVQLAGNVPLNYNIRYYLYTMFRPQYHASESFDTIYIAQTHCNITRRLYRYIHQLNLTGTTYYEAPFCYGLDKTKFPLDSSNPDSHKYKFFPTLLLVRGCKYIYITEEGIHHVVRLKDILFKDNEIESLIISFLKGTKDVETIKRVKLNYYQILPDYRNWLCKTSRIDNKNDIWQFPLRPYVLTYHATVGRTIDEAPVELSAECVYANFLYVGLCSVRQNSDIHKIHDERDLPGYLITKYMETLSANEDSKEYYYRCDLTKSEIDEYIDKKDGKNLDNIKWTTMNDIHNFERRRTGFIRIKRSEYQKSNKKVDTPFMQITKFVKENRDAILHTIEISPFKDFDKYCKKEKKKKEGEQQQEDEKSDALCYLIDEYNQWFN
ncbi:uncharacterized protein LOC122577331 [Bombus pyrosoma]|uniref:uncharacterized protein LOC122577331 n=1 Tax=Bombus pyrosoma TaxID=396416 RepID=UPI001CB90BA8|nr:uncharacterized protein LOC122577331 [Bombus pyrosoma]